MLAAKLGCLDIVQQCLAAGANVDHVSANGATALMYAAKAGFTAITQVLLDARANVHVVDNRGETAIKLAVRRGHSNIAWLLFDHGAMYVDEEDYERASYRSRTNREASGEMQAQLCHAAAIGDLPVVRRMLTAGIDVNVVDDEKSTPLLLACFRRHDEIIQELLEYGPNVNSSNKFGFTPLYHAAAHSNFPLASTLLALGAAVDTADKFGWTPVMIAARNGYADVVQLLLDSNASPSRRNQMGKTARDIAFSKGHDYVVAVLDACLESYRAKGISALEALDFQAAVDSFSELIHAVNPPLPFDVFQRCQAWDGLGCASLVLDDAKAYLGRKRSMDWQKLDTCSIANRIIPKQCKHIKVV
ncbi:hypothetical protein AC1031_017099 [Aphanomyces cochlioides]|nr:hypothetical protein AC1031_017099 [Aphanomyces cochlioides]